MAYFSDKPFMLTKSIYIVLFFIMLHALISLLAWYVVGDNLIFVPEVKTYTFSYLFYYVYTDSDSLNAMRTIDIFGFPFFRGSGIFWEPGILQIYMNILFFISLFVYPNKRIAQLTSLVIVTTWSSTGLVILILQIAFYVIIKVSKKNLFKTVVLIAIFAALIIPIKKNLSDKFEGQDAGSGFARILDTMTAINIIKNYPLLGIEVDTKVYERALSDNRAVVEMKGTNNQRDAHNTNSVLNYAVFFGIPLALLLLYSLYGQTIFMKNKILFFFIVVIAISTEPIGFYIFPLILIFSKYILKYRAGGNYEFRSA
ncbi:MAG: O-antigen ligase family protein [Pseudomonadota bacterium]